MIEAALRQRVSLRAGNRCEYCLTHQEDDPLYTFHVEHIIPKKHGGHDRPLNLAWSCHNCNYAKGPNLSGRSHGKTVDLFHPRRQKWSRHFRWNGAQIVGRTHTGRATVAVLRLNAPHRLALRAALLTAGVTPGSGR